MIDGKRVALLHYWLTNMRGGEKVLSELCRMFPDADIYTHAFNPEKIASPICDHRIYESFIASLPGARRGCQKYLPLMPAALKRWNLNSYELLISSESGPVKGIRKAPGSIHICYCHTPMRYLWDMYEDYYRSTGAAGKLAMTLFKRYLRKYDLSSAETVDHFIANSAFVAERISRIYHRESTVIHPPVDIDFFEQSKTEKEDYYLFAGELISYKRPDLAAAACAAMGKKLLLVGNGPMREKLEAQYRGKNILFAGRLDSDQLRAAYSKAKALVFPGVEDFGIVPVEAQAAGTPVIALRRGGALETVQEGKSGVFFDLPDQLSLCGAIETFESRSWTVEDCRENAEKFSTPKFHDRMRCFLESVIP